VGYCQPITAAGRPTSKPGVLDAVGCCPAFFTKWRSMLSAGGMRQAQLPVWMQVNLQSGPVQQITTWAPDIAL
jgi:hypothetical protein